jgi:hypothetical protein
MKWVAATGVVAGFFVAGCGSGSLPRVAVLSPGETALAWFKAIDDHDMALAKAHFVPASREEMSWSDFDSVSFSNVQCALRSQAVTTAVLRCTFTPHAPAGDQVLLDFYWTVYMQRQGSGPWLITDYGQP